MPSPTAQPAARERRDFCPGVLRPWPADDGALVRVRLVGGAIGPASLRALGVIAATYGDDQLHLTSRANVQLRGLPSTDGAVEPEVLDAFERAGVLPSHTHERVRNLMVSPQTGWGGRADLRPVAAQLDRLLCADPALADLAGRFLFVLDDGRGDLVDRSLDLGLVAVDDAHAQLRVGSLGWGPVVPLTHAAAALIDLAREFLARRGEGPAAAWHVDELGTDLVPGHERDARTHVRTDPPAYGEVPGGTHVPAPDGVVDLALLTELLRPGVPLVVTPWHGVLVTRSSPVTP